ncbi:hypothetical protein B0T26DRAFT_757903 [Lasiosphaeria miniovina]|uniref:Uncharacterized protein n=1 Tax=Lasiosphaeria miniovina TaxID=1954250 RepID=A0AA40DHV5_9PEZI|nr:uncharacterized protein B0T26DRAFT_757903 [Lasiosphaeria miniovina]KAK0701931.1 hypothetical protein B0T26DRAFT_757903 [Lasiosphaeria miniovina]
MASVATTTAYNPILTRPSDWPAWYNSLKRVANDRELLDAVDINNDGLPPPKVLPYSFEDFLGRRYPQATPRTAIELRDLADNATIQQMQSWRSFESEQREKKNSYEREIDLVREVKEWIRTNTAATYMNLAESDRATLKDIIRKLHSLAAGTYNANWMNTVVMKSAEAELKGSEQEDLPYYANTFRLVCEVEPSRSNSAFSTFNGKPEGDRPTYTCPCRPDAAFHKPEKCWGLREVITEKKGKHHIPQKRLDYTREQLEKPEWKDLTEKIKNGTTEGKKDWPKTAAMISMINALNYGPHPLSRSVIFDTGASIHVVNSKAMLAPGTFTPSTGDDSIQVGDSHLEIDGRGTWVFPRW